MPVCLEPGCPTIIGKGARRCTTHARTTDRARGTRQQRGYDATHDRTRAAWAPRVAHGTVTCWRCGELIAATAQWDLGHDDHDRTIYRGPEHVRCNRATAGRGQGRP